MRQTQDQLARRNEMLRKRRSYQSEELRQRHLKRRQKRKRQIAFVRSASAFVLVCILVCVILFMTPLFKTRRINVSGNNVVTYEEISLRIGYLDGENLFKISKREVRDSLFEIAYIENVDISKNYLKTTLDINITERTPAAYFVLAGKYVLFDESCVILAESTEKPQNIPLIIGISDEDTADVSLMMGQERVDVMIECISLMNKLGFLDKVNSIDLSDLTQISFKYEDRLDVTCGSNIDMERKLRFFHAAVNNSNLAPNARGTMDLSVTGNVLYTTERQGAQN